MGLVETYCIRLRPKEDLERSYLCLRRNARSIAWWGGTQSMIWLGSSDSWASRTWQSMMTKMRRIAYPRLCKSQTIMWIPIECTKTPTFWGYVAWRDANG